MEQIIKDYPNYIVYSNGKVYSIKNKKYLTPRIDHKGYVCYRLSKDGLTKEFKAHRLVANAFIANDKHLPQVNHIDENKTNNDVSNLEWCDGKYNMNYGSRKNCKAKAVAQIDTTTNSIIETFISAIEASRKLHIEQGGISMCARHQCNTYKGYRWRYLEEEMT